MSKYKYPYIPKEYYPAVMFACKMIRENGYFNQAVDRAARYYGVNKNELARHIRARQAAGQRGKPGAAKDRKYHWYAMHVHTYAGYSVEIVKAIDKDHAMKKVFDKWHQAPTDIDAEDYVLDFKECETKKEAQDYASEWDVAYWA